MILADKQLRVVLKSNIAKTQTIPLANHLMKLYGVMEIMQFKIT